MVGEEDDDPSEDEFALHKKVLSNQYFRRKAHSIHKERFSDQTLHRIGQRFFVKMVLHDIYALLVRVEIHRNMTK